jgi:hypothetical protein
MKLHVNKTSISGQLRYTYISRQAFMGGSVLYNPDQPSSGQPVEGAHVAVRLGRVTAEYQGDIPVFNDIEEDARYGYITVNSIDKAHIAFTYTEYSADGGTPRASAFALPLNGELDINGDGVNDVAYTRPLRKRLGFEEAVYLTFISSQEELRTAMFAALPEQYSRGVYPSGLMGINPDDKWLVSKYEGSTATRAAARGISKGDYVLDAQLGKYQRFVGSGAPYRSARSISDSDLETAQTAEAGSFYFSEAEFQGAYSAEALFNALPAGITSLFAVGLEGMEADFIRRLNELLEHTDLVTAIIVEMEPETPQAELDSLLSQAKSIAKDELVKLNRLSLEELYAERPSVMGAAITEILPLASVLIANPEADEEAAADRQLRGVMQAVDYDDYKKKKAAIDDKFSVYYPLKLDEDNKLVYTLPDIIKKISGDTAKKSDDSNSVAKTNQLANLIQWDNTICLQVGVHGIFKITWGSIRAGVALALYTNGETGLTASKNFFEFDRQENPTLKEIFNYKKTIDALTIPLDFLKAPPIVIGVISIKAELKGFVKLPFTVYAKGNITTTIYVGFTGLYAAGFEVGADYGIRTKKVKILWVTIEIPDGFYFSPYAKGVLVDDLAWYIGPAGDVYTGVKLQSAKMGFICEPSVSFGPLVTICDLVYGGVSIGPTIELGYEIGTLTNSKTSAITGIYGDLITGVGIDARYHYGINPIPLVLEKRYYGDGILKRLIGVEKKAYRHFTKNF